MHTPPTDPPTPHLQQPDVELEDGGAGTLLADADLQVQQGAVGVHLDRQGGALLADADLQVQQDAVGDALALEGGVN